MASLSAIRAGAKETLSTIAGGDVKELNVIDRPPTQISALPAVFLGGRAGNLVTQDEGNVVRVPIVAIAGTDLDYTHDTLDRFIDGDLSIDDCIEATPSLGLDGVTAHLIGEWEDTFVTIGGVEYVGVRFTLEVQY